MTIELDQIPNATLRRFLNLLRHDEIPRVIVVGGAVRDFFFNRDPNDIDIAVKLTLTPADSALLEQSLVIGSRCILPRVSEALDPLVKKLGGHVEDFLDRSLAFEGMRLDLLGLYLLTDASGRLKLPDIFVNEATGAIYNAKSELSINQLGIDGDGRLYGDPRSLNDIEHRRGRLVASPLGITLRNIVRALDAKQRFGLSFDTTSARLILNRIDHLHQNPTLLSKEFEEEDTWTIARRICPEKKHREDRTGSFEMRIIDWIKEVVHREMG